jgi:pimeloyl-ACP methyl ester carboxylesterase
VPAEPWTASAPAFADAIEDAIEALVLGPATFMGNSVGGFASARLAIRRSELVKALVLIDSGGFVPRGIPTKAFCAVMGHPGVIRRFYPRFAHRYMRASTEEDRRIEAVATALATTAAGATITAGLWRSFSSPAHDLRWDVDKIQAPTLVVWGARDPVIPLRVGRRMASAIKGAELVVLDAGHVPYATHPQAFLDAVLPFLAASLSPRS